MSLRKIGIDHNINLYTNVLKGERKAKTQFLKSRSYEST